MTRRQLRFVPLLLASCLSACVSVRSDLYPREWSPPVAVADDACPRIAGKYFDDGVVTEKLSAYCETESRRKYPPRDSWNCDRRLSTNLGREGPHGAGSSPETWIEIEQPDADTLRITVPDDRTILPWTLKRSAGDFKCDGSAVTVSTWGSIFSSRTRPAAAGAITTGGLALFGWSGGVAASSRSFRPLPDGALTMEVKDSQTGVLLAAFWFSLQANGFVRWEPYRPAASPLAQQTK